MFDERTVASGIRAIASALSLDVATVEQLALDAECINANTVTSLFQSRPFRYAGYLRTGSGTVVIKTGPYDRVRLFDADFIVFPAAFTRLPSRRKLPSSAAIFALMPPRETQVDTNSTTSQLDFDHVEGALAYVRFYVRDRAVIAVELQSDVYGQLISNKSRTHYAHWYRVLLLAFERYVRTVYGTEGIEIQIVTREYITRRFPAINPALAIRLYDSLPTQFGYVVTTLSEGLAFEPVSNPSPITSVWSKLISETESSELACRCASYYSHRITDRLSPQWKYEF